MHKCKQVLEPEKRAYPLAQRLLVKDWRGLLVGKQGGL
jgi:RNA polymerase subunit RPABC4/transcription elongation factor Spt4